MAGVQVISVIFPARSRPDRTKLSIDSLLERAKAPEDVELLVALDRDDPTLAAQVAVLRDTPAEYIVGERHGYAGLHHYYNALAKDSVGDHILIWNDDTEMKTDGWDALIEANPDFSIQFLRRDVVKTSDFTFFSVGRDVYNAMGFISTEPAIDLFCSHVALHSGVAVVCDNISFHHACLPTEYSRDTGDVHSLARRVDRRDAIYRVLNAPGYEGRFIGYHVQSCSLHTGIPYSYEIAGAIRNAVTYRVEK